MSGPRRRILVIGYGNPGRLDDGLGPALAAALTENPRPHVTVETDYQLNVEDAATIAEHDLVLFADAAVKGPEPFWVRRARPAGSGVSFTSHSCSPEALLALAENLFAADVEAYAIGIRGWEFNEFGEQLSPRARKNLAAAIDYVSAALDKGQFEEIRSEAPELLAE